MSAHQVVPIPGHQSAYDISKVVPTARPVNDERVPLHRLPTKPGQSFKPRSSRGRTEVNGEHVRFYWCLACNRCLPHWRSAFCQQHLADYKRLRRRQREGKTGTARLDRSLIERLVDTANESLRADTRLREAPNDGERRRESNRLRGELLTLILDEFARHA